MIKFTNGDWIRKCNECGHSQKAIKPNQNKELSISYTEAKCKKCHSTGLDYGRHYYDESEFELDE